MSYEYLIITVLTIIGSVFGFYLKVKKDILDQETKRSQPIIELNQNIIKLNEKLGFINEMIDTLKQRVTAHGKEIDELRNDVSSLKTKVDTYHK